MRTLYEVKITYTDGTDEVLLFHAGTPDEAEVEAEAWVDYKKIVKDISCIGESKNQRRGKAGGSHG